MLVEQMHVKAPRGEGRGGSCVALGRGRSGTPNGTERGERGGGDGAHGARGLSGEGGPRGGGSDAGRPRAADGDRSDSPLVLWRWLTRPATSPHQVDELGKLAYATQREIAKQGIARPSGVAAPLAAAADGFAKLGGEKAADAAVGAAAPSVARASSGAAVAGAGAESAADQEAAAKQAAAREAAAASQQNNRMTNLILFFLVYAGFKYVMDKD